jgi:ribosomal protein L21E
VLPDLPWFVYLILLAPLGLILGAAAYKSLQVRAAREWPSAAGKVVVSKAEVRKVKVIDGDREEGHRFEERNFADIVYEYSVAGRKLRNNRVSIGEDRGNFEVAETIAKYPVGTVVTVYYNPLHPDQAVLERDLPKGMWGCLGIGTAIVLTIVFGSAIGLHKITEFVTTRIPQQGNAAASVAFGAFGTAVALFALALHRQASLAMKWPVVTGTIKLSDIEQYRAAPAEGRSRGQTMYQRRVSYTYKYNNLTYTNTQATLASSVASTSSWLVRKSTTDYKNGASVKVWVNPENPAQATLEPRTGFVWVIWLSAVAIWSVAYYAAVHG